MIQVFLLNYWKNIVVGILLCLVVVFGYYKIKAIGYDEASKKYEKQIAEYNLKLDKRIEFIQQSSSLLVENAILSREQNAKDFADILAAAKIKPLYTIINGTCAPSPDFAKAYNDAVTRANRK